MFSTWIFSSIPVSFLVGIAMGNAAVTTMKICGVSLVIVGYSLFVAVDVVRDEGMRKMFSLDFDLGVLFRCHIPIYYVPLDAW